MYDPMIVQTIGRGGVDWKEACVFSVLQRVRSRKCDFPHTVDFKKIVFISYTSRWLRKLTDNNCFMSQALPCVGLNLGTKPTA